MNLRPLALPCARLYQLPSTVFGLVAGSSDYRASSKSVPFVTREKTREQRKVVCGCDGNILRRNVNLWYTNDQRGIAKISYEIPDAEGIAFGITRNEKRDYNLYFSEKGQGNLIMGLGYERCYNLRISAL